MQAFSLSRNLSVISLQCANSELQSYFTDLCRTALSDTQQIWKTSHEILARIKSFNMLLISCILGDVDLMLLFLTRFYNLSLCKLKICQRKTARSDRLTFGPSTVLYCVRH